MQRSKRRNRLRRGFKGHRGAGQIRSHLVMSAGRGDGLDN
jgi:hypothetical protein